MKDMRLSRILILCLLPMPGLEITGKVSLPTVLFCGTKKTHDLSPCLFSFPYSLSLFFIIIIIIIIIIITIIIAVIIIIIIIIIARLYY